MRKIFIIILILLLINVDVHADGIDSLIDEQLNHLDLDELQKFADEIVMDAEGMISEIVFLNQYIIL
ncbi:hypothetical protein [Lutispora sp.]|uniref:hypothetical protein n=1 Tax=Lutispora sp. TaxID=2828727 RepID=UPI00356ABE2F